MMKTTTVQKEQVLDCADIVEIIFVYQMNNACYKCYTLEYVQKSVEFNYQTLHCGDESLKNVEPCSRRLRCVCC